MSQFNSQCNEFTIVWSMFVPNRSMYLLFTSAWEYWPDTLEWITWTNALQIRCSMCIQWSWGFALEHWPDTHEFITWSAELWNRWTTFCVISTEYISCVIE